MSDVLHRLLRVEGEAKQTLQKAEEEGARKTESARAEAREIIQNARRQALQQAEELISSELEDATQQQQRAVEEAQREAPSVESLDPRRLQQAVKLVTDVIAHGAPEGG